MTGPCVLTKPLRLAILLGGLGVGALPAAAADAPFWPQFHGPKRNNLSTETGLLKQWPEGGPRLLWTARRIGHGFASVSMADGLVYTCGNIDGKTVITALDLKGNIQWQVENGAAWTGDKEGTRGTPTIDGNRLYHESPLGQVVCLDAKTGDKVWSLNILEKFASKNITWALAESLLVDGDHLICCPGGPNTAVVALDKKTGRTVWKSPSTGDLAGYSSPILAEYKGLRMILRMTSRAVIAVNADTGDLLWRFPHKSPWDENIFTPIFHDGHVFITSRTTGSVMLKVNVVGDKASVQQVWRSRDLDNHHGGVVFLDGYLYGSCVAPRWVCLDWKTGRTMYTAPGVGKGSLTYADRLLYTLGENSKMGLVKPTPAGHDLISEFRIPAGAKGLSWAHPVVCGGRLYIRHSDFLYAYDVRGD
jgi:outer membrane protein assembly factor BamB